MFILGDIHGEKSLMTSFLASKEKYCLQLGDFGFIWKYNDWKWNKFLNHFEKDYPEKVIFTVLGNHENYDSYDKMTQCIIAGARCYKVRKNVFAVMRGEVLTLEEKNILCVGGADSHDADLREPFKSWWPQERVTGEDISRAKQAIQKYSMIDIIATHCMPYEISFKMGFSFPYESELQLSKLFRALYETDHIPKIWYSGHYHIDASISQLDTKFKILGIGTYEII